MRLPVWLVLAFSAAALLWGSYRIWLGLRRRPTSEDRTQRRGLAGGLDRMNPRSHVLVGVIYLVLGGALGATAFGWHPFGHAHRPAPTAPAKR